MDRLKRLFLLGLLFFILTGADYTDYEEFKVKWIHSVAQEVTLKGESGIYPVKPWTKEWDTNGDLKIDSREIVPMLKFVEDWRVHRLWQGVHKIDAEGADKVHITRKRFLSKWDTNGDWYIDSTEVAPVREELNRVNDQRLQDGHY